MNTDNNEKFPSFIYCNKMATKWGQTLKAEYTTILISLIKGSADGLTGEVYTHLKIVFGENPKTILPEYNCNQDLVF